MSPIMNNWGARLEPKSGGAGEESGWGPVQGEKKMYRRRLSLLSFLKFCFPHFTRTQTTILVRC